MRRRLNIGCGGGLAGDARKRTAVCVAAISLAALTLVPLGHGAETNRADQAGSPGSAAPDFALTDLSGKTVRLSEFRGKVVLLDFWATWCAPCQEEIPELVQLQKQYSSKGFTVLGVALDEAGSAVVKPVAQKLRVNYPVVAGNTRVAAAYGGIQALPTAFLVGRDGRILKTYVGAQKRDKFQKDIRSALGQPGGASAHSHAAQGLPVKNLAPGGG